LSEAIEEQNASAWQTLRAFEKPFVFLAGEEENLHFLTNSIPGAQGQPHERSHAGHFTQEEIGDILADRVIRFIEANPELLAAPAYVEVEHGRNGKSEEKEKEERMRSMRSAAFPYEKKRAEVRGRSMAYVDEDQGDLTLTLFSGSPSSSVQADRLFDSGVM
jgi:hypothetical protein